MTKSFLAALNALNNSILYNWTSPAIPILISSEDYTGIDIDSASYLTVIPPVVTILAAPVHGFLMDRRGRKFCLLLSGMLHTLAWVCVLSSTSLYILYLSRVLFGFANAAMFTSMPAYISEVTTPKVRGRWGNLMAFFMYFGQFVSNAIGYFFDINTAAYISISTPLIFLVMFGLCPETPYYYLLKNAHTQAEESLKKLRRKHDVSKEFSQLDADVKRQLSEKGTLKDCFRIQSNRKAILIVGVCRVLQQFTGIHAFAAYNQYIFQEAGGALDKGYSSMIYALSLSMCSLIVLIFIDKLGRRKPMIFSSIGCFIALATEAIYFGIKDYTSINHTSFSWYPIAGMVFYVIAFASGLGLIPILLIGELISTAIRSKAGTIITITSACFMTLINKLFQVLMSNYGLTAPFTLFGTFSFICIFVSYFYVPETKGKTLEEIQQMLKGNDKNKQTPKIDNITNHERSNV